MLHPYTQIFVTENLGQAAAAAKEYFQRLCKWDNVDIGSVKLFGHDLVQIEEEVSQISIFATQEYAGMTLLSYRLRSRTIFYVQKLFTVAKYKMYY